MNRFAPVRRTTAAPPSAVTPPAPRAGTSLVEVLMSLLVMGVGVVAVATLFPASVLRSVQATQLTNATTLRYNAEAAIDIDPRLIYDPDMNGNDYTAGSVTRSFVIDPWGRAVNGTNSIGAGGTTLPRHNLGRTTETAAATFVTQPDSWVMEPDVELIPQATNQTGSPARTVSVRLNPNDTTGAGKKVDLADLASQIQNGITYRVTLFDGDGRLSEVRNLTYVDATHPIDSASDEINWTSSPLPNGSRFTSISRIRIERLERRYSWIMTVRRPASASTTVGTPIASEVAVAVLFRRSHNPDEELAYTVAKDPNSTGSRPEYTVSSIAGNPTTKPFVKKGGFLLDPRFGRWYRITSVGGTPTSPRIRLDRTPSKNEPLTEAVFFRGVIDVFPFSKTVTVR